MKNKLYQRHRSYCRLFCYRSRGCDDGKVWYLFYEVGTAQDDTENKGKKLGESDRNKLYLNNNGSLSGSPAHKLSKKYVVTQIRANVL